MFRSAFTQHAKVLFRDDSKQNGLRHPGEFGTYREAICAEFLHSFLPQRLAIDSGFIVNSLGGISRQIDLVVYDPSLTPPLESKSRQRFFPVETVIAVGEVRSDISYDKFADALQRLAEVKALREQLSLNQTPVVRWPYLGQSQYNPKENPFDQIFTFLICNKFEFSMKSKLITLLNSVYDNIDYQRRHNCILSLQDGLLSYEGLLNNGDCAHTYIPKFFGGDQHINQWITFSGNDYAPYKQFCSSIFMHACHCTVAFADLSQYTINGRYNVFREVRV